MSSRFAPFALLLAPLLVTACTSASVQYGHPNGHSDHQGGYQDTAPQPALRIPPGHLPPPGSCRIWFPGTPPGHQPPPGNCAQLAGRVPRGAWLIERPYDEPECVAVSEYGPRQSGVSVEVRIYDADTGRFIGFRGEARR